MRARASISDETTVPVQAKGKCRTGRLWTYVRDDRPFAGPDPPAAAFTLPNAPFCVLHVGASTPLKQWPPDRWRRLADRIPESSHAQADLARGRIDLAHPISWFSIA